MSRNQPQQPEIALVGGMILTHPGVSEPIAHGITTMADGILLQVNAPLEATVSCRTVIDCTGCLIMPGLINCHTHAAMSLLRGMADDLPLDRWLGDYMFPAEARHAGPDFVYLGTLISAVEMALGGITTFADGYFFMEKAAEAAIRVGLRSVIAQGVLDVPVPDAGGGEWRTRAEEFLASCPGDATITPALFCHSPYLCGPETLRQAGRMAWEHGTSLFCHVAETEREVEDVRRLYGRTPVAHLHELDILGPSFVAVHAVHVSAGEMEIIAGSGTRVVHCPESNMKLSSGAAAVADLVAMGITVGLGTDGPASNNNLDLFEEMRSASFLAKLVSRNPEALDARTVLRMATGDAAKVLGMEERIGSLEPGKFADAIVIGLGGPHLTPMYDVASHLVYSARASDVRDVIVNGRLVVANGRITTVNWDQLRAEACAVASEIAKGLGISLYGA